ARERTAGPKTNPNDIPRPVFGVHEGPGRQPIEFESRRASRCLKTQDEIRVRVGHDLGGQVKTDNFWTGKTDNFQAAETREFYFEVSSVRKSVWTFVRQLLGPHLSTCA